MKWNEFFDWINKVYNQLDKLTLERILNKLDYAGNYDKSYPMKRSLEIQKRDIKK